MPHIKRIHIVYSDGIAANMARSGILNEVMIVREVIVRRFLIPQRVIGFHVRMAPGRFARRRLFYRQCHIDLRPVCTHNTTVLCRLPITLMILLLLLCVIWLDPTSRQTASPSIKSKFILFVYTNEVDDPPVLFAQTSRGRFVIAQI